MTRIFFSLALFAMALLGVNLTIGLAIGDYNSSVARWREAVVEVRTLERQRPTPDAERLASARQAQAAATAELTPRRDRVRLHWLFGLSAALVTVLVNSVTVTYFIGTSRWCKEVSETYGLDPQLVSRSNHLKRRTFPWAVTSMLTVVGVVALGGAADPATGREGTALWVTPHLLGAMTGLMIVAWIFFVEWQNIAANHEVINDVMTEVRKIREAKGLEV